MEQSDTLPLNEEIWNKYLKKRWIRRNKRPDYITVAREIITDYNLKGKFTDLNISKKLRKLREEMHSVTYSIVFG
jgi:hypothetical protein